MNKKGGARSGSPVFCLYRNARTCLVAPHAVDHYKGGRYKRADLRTGGIATSIADFTGSSVVCSAYRHASMQLAPGRRPLDRAVRRAMEVTGCEVVVDVHGARDGLGFDVAVGAGTDVFSVDQRSVAAVITHYCGQFGLIVGMNVAGFRGNSPRAITRHLVTHHGVCALQIELSRSCRGLGPSQSPYTRCMQALALSFLRINGSTGMDGIALNL